MLIQPIFSLLNSKVSGFYGAKEEEEEEKPREAEAGAGDSQPKAENLLAPASNFDLAAVDLDTADLAAEDQAAVERATNETGDHATSDKCDPKNEEETPDETGEDIIHL